MKSVVNINGQVCFNPNTHKLERKEKEGFSLLLNVPASRCLSLLIQHKGEIVSQEHFFREVWHQYGMNVSPNTLYQNISILRRSLDKCGLSTEIILTVPRKGFTLSSSVVISLDEDKNEVSLSSVLNFDQNQAQGDMTPVPEKKFPIDLNNEKKQSERKQLEKKQILLFVMAGCGLFLAGVLSGMVYDKINSSPERHAVNSNENKWYLTSNLLFPKDPLIRCQSPLNDTSKATCLSNYYLINQHEHN